MWLLTSHFKTMNLKIHPVTTLWSVSGTVPQGTKIPDGYTPDGYYSSGTKGTMNVYIHVVADTFEGAMKRTQELFESFTFVSVARRHQIHLP